MSEYRYTSYYLNQKYNKNVYQQKYLNNIFENHMDIKRDIHQRQKEITPNSKYNNANYINLNAFVSKTQDPNIVKKSNQNYSNKYSTKQHINDNFVYNNKIEENNFSHKTPDKYKIDGPKPEMKNTKEEPKPKLNPDFEKELLKVFIYIYCYEKMMMEKKNI